MSNDDTSKRRGRSNAIAITKVENNFLHDEYMAEMANYDYATWQMYNRIVSHRRRRQIANACIPENANWRSEDAFRKGATNDPAFSAVTTREKGTSCFDHETIFVLEL